MGILAVVAVIIFLIASAGGQAGSDAPPASVSVDQAYQMYQDGMFVLDVRTPEEWDEFHAPDTTLIPLDELSARVGELPKDRPILVVCRSGNRSQAGRDILRQAGFEAASMDGGLNEWRERGYPVMSVDCQRTSVTRLVDKIRLNAEKIAHYDEEQTDGADVVLVTYGITARVARRAIDMARRKGVKVGVIRLIVVWPFPEKRIRELAGKIKAFVVPEINYGQMVLEVERCAAGKASTTLVPHMGGGVHDPMDIVNAIMEAAK